MRRWLTPERINTLAGDPANCTRRPEALVVDLGRPFVPEEYTQLFYTDLYPSLTFDQRLRYNQLFGLRINEYIMMLEADLVERLLPPLLRLPQVANDPALVQAVRTMIAEEKKHFETFAALNRAAHPALYPAGADRYFSVLPLIPQAMFWVVGRLSGQFAFALWYLMAMEESSMAMARDMARQPMTATLGALDPAFMEVHRQHMKDEARHLHIDGRMIDACIGTGSALRRRINAWLFRSMMGGVTRLSRSGSGVRVIRQWVGEMPELAAREEEMVRAVLALKDSLAFQKSLFNRRIMPMTFAVFDDTREFADLGAKVVGYDRH